MDHAEHPTIELIDEEEGGGGWIMVYADLMTLLLTFFILLFMFSTINVDKFEKVLASIQENLGDSPPSRYVLHPTGGLKTGPQPIPMDRSPVIETFDIIREIQTFIQVRELGPQIEVHLEKSNVIIRIKDKTFFGSGVGTLHGEAKAILNDIIAVFQRFPEYRINIKGHTDNVPISTPQFPSNWELSAIRATTVLRHLLDKGVSPLRLTATGFADSMPLVPNDTERQRAQNRRVEFVLEKDKP